MRYGRRGSMESMMSLGLPTSGAVLLSASDLATIQNDISLFSSYILTKQGSPDNSLVLYILNAMVRHALYGSPIELPDVKKKTDDLVFFSDWITNVLHGSVAGSPSIAAVRSGLSIAADQAASAGRAAEAEALRQAAATGSMPGFELGSFLRDRWQWIAGGVAAVAGIGTILYIRRRKGARR